MKHTEQYVQTILTKMLRADDLNSFNEDNPISQTKKYSRTSHVRIYKKGQRYAMVKDCLLTRGDCFRSDQQGRTSHGMFQRIFGKGIKVQPLIFHYNIGSWNFNLWYSETVLQNQNSHVYKSRERLLENFGDFFILLREKDKNDNNSIKTMIYCSWRVRDDTEKL